MIPWLPPEPVFPPVESALTHPPELKGLLAAGGDLSPARLIAAYTLGIFPWYSEGDPILWWSLNPRMVLFPDELRINHSFAKTLRKHHYEVRFDTAFADVMTGCAAPRKKHAGTWIVPEMQAAYLRLHELGYAHSIETWVDNELVGGMYGVAIGKAFFGESMFSRHNNASKIAIAHLCALLRIKGFGIIDCQMETTHLASLGARPIPRSEFSARLTVLTQAPEALSLWSAEPVQDYYRKARQEK